MTTAKTKATAAGAAMVELIFATTQCYYRLRAAGAKVGAVSRWGGGTWGLLRSLKIDGPQTVPQLARARPVARQRIQKIADELAAAGLVAFIANPAHKRSRLLQLTARGERAFARIDARVAEMAEELAADLPPEDLDTTLRTLRTLRDRLAAVQ